jgi:C1A family cysteine protease
MSFLLKPFQFIAWMGQSALAPFTTSTIRRYGWKPDLPDIRDHFHCFEDAEALPSSCSLRDSMPPIYDQGHLGSCTANAVGAAIQYDELKQGLACADAPSRLFIYYNERSFEGTVGQDSGASIRDGIKAITKFGYCSESEWPYDIAKFADKPPKQCYNDAMNHKALQYRRVQQSLDDIRRVIQSGYPIVFGISVYDSFESEEVSTTGVVPMPRKSESLLGGHAILLVSYDDDKKRFGFRNSWGKWGENGTGYGYLPYDYVTNPNLAQDLWTVTKIN